MMRVFVMSGRAQRGYAAFLFGVAVAFASTSCVAEARRPRKTSAVEDGSVPFQQAAGRIIVTLDFTRPDGSSRPALAWLNMGTPGMAVSAALARDLDVHAGRPLAFHLGRLAVDVPPERVEVGAPKLDGEDVLTHLFAPMPVEAILPASVLQRYELVLDMPGRRLTLAPPGTVAPQGIALPMEINPETGVAAVEATLAGERHTLALDAGASFTWLRGDLVRRWLGTHPDWLLADGAVGASNMGLTSLGLERHGMLVRLPEMTLADRVPLSDVDAFGTAPLLCSVCDQVVGDLFWDRWQRDAPRPVAGWLGADVLAGVRLTVDYANRTLYWFEPHQTKPLHIAQVGVTLERHGGAYGIGGIVSRHGEPTVDGVEAGDQLLAVDEQPVQNQSSDEVFRALGGISGLQHLLTLERAGRLLKVSAPVTVFSP